MPVSTECGPGPTIARFERAGAEVFRGQIRNEVVPELLGIRLRHSEHPSSPTTRVKQIGCHLTVRQTRPLSESGGRLILHTTSAKGA